MFFYLSYNHMVRPYLGGVRVVRSNPPFWIEPPFLIEFSIDNVEFTTSRWNSNPPFSIERTPVLKTSNRDRRLTPFECKKLRRLPPPSNSKNFADYPPSNSRIQKTSPTTPPRRIQKPPPSNSKNFADYPPPSNFQVKKTNPPLEKPIYGPAMVKVDFFLAIRRHGLPSRPYPHAPSSTPEYNTGFERNLDRNNELRESGARMKEMKRFLDGYYCYYCYAYVSYFVEGRGDRGRSLRQWLI